MDLNDSGLIPEGVADLVDYVDGITLPPAIKKSLWKAIGDLIAGAVDVPVAYLESKAQQIRMEAQGLAFITKKSAEAAAQKFGGDDQLVERAVSHFGQKLFKEQINREKVVAQTIEELKNDPPKQDSGSEIDDDWLSMFSRIAEQKSNQDVQLFLAKILAGEIRKPGSYSPQTIQILSTLSQNIAQLFQAFCDASYFMPLVNQAGLITDPFGNAGSNALTPVGLSYSNLTALQDAGLIQHDLNAWREIPPILFTMPFSIGGKTYNMIPNGISQQDLISLKPKIKVINFTEPGLQLRSVLHLGTNPTYETQILSWLKTQHKLIPISIS
ncbi:DUF2806 domain-containing protein [Hymenobacter taeanensis]|uniref:DUF2806 domain-containing protein n=1 Tax=Hymenobacter taeanensis TaxID=2735321 RepID=A0A6M6BFC8_9BACT|nr:MULTISPECIES: DUF2806 domain-containing protein [Hymenobacter]QJX46642.1 DUF2806 domain-containing protein [Hymenobacter taeanensis]UOQ80506.1 DUF2806 domain-containing protein [Hymenobacter sp. 5414T-23]